MDKIQDIIVSIIIPCLNSENTLRLTLDSLTAQDFPKDNIEILIIDGGSTDMTRSIALAYGAKIIENPRVQPECAKHEGILHANGKYTLFIDSDEAFLENNAITRRVQILADNPDCHIVLTDGYLRPDGYSAVHDYMNTFSDPFSFFMYEKHSSYRSFFLSWRKYKKLKENDVLRVFAIHPNIDMIPLVDLCAGNMIDLDYVREQFSSEIKDVNIIPELFSKLIFKDENVAVTVGSPIWHYSSDSITKYIYKLRWRVIVNIHYADTVGVGFTNRVGYQNVGFQYKKYLFLPYSFLFFPAFFIGIFFAIRFKSPILILHGFLTSYVGFLIIWYMLLKILHIKPLIPTYGQK